MSSYYCWSYTSEHMVCICRATEVRIRMVKTMTMLSQLCCVQHVIISHWSRTCV